MAGSHIVHAKIVTSTTDAVVNNYMCHSGMCGFSLNKFHGYKVESIRVSSCTESCSEIPF